MKVRKKKKGAESGEGEASAIMVSQGALSCTLPDRRCFLGQGPASASRQGFTLVDTFKKKNTGIERGQGGREAAEGIYRVSFLQRERPGDAQRFVYSSLESQIPPLFFSPPLLSSSLLTSHRLSMRCAGHRPDSGRNCCIRSLHCLDLLVCFDFLFFFFPSLCHLSRWHLALFLRVGWMLVRLR